MEIHELINNGFKTVTFSLTYTALCNGGEGQSWCLSDSLGPAKRPNFQSLEDNG